MNSNIHACSCVCAERNSAKKVIVSTTTLEKSEGLRGDCICRQILLDRCGATRKGNSCTRRAAYGALPPEPVPSSRAPPVGEFLVLLDLCVMVLRRGRQLVWVVMAVIARKAEDFFSCCSVACAQHHNSVRSKRSPPPLSRCLVLPLTPSERRHSSTPALKTSRPPPSRSNPSTNS